MSFEGRRLFKMKSGRFSRFEAGALVRYAAGQTVWLTSQEATRMGGMVEPAGEASAAVEPELPVSYVEVTAAQDPFKLEIEQESVAFVEPTERPAAVTAGFSGKPHPEPTILFGGTAYGGVSDEVEDESVLDGEDETL